MITENFQEDKHKNDFKNLLRALISPFTKLNVKYPWLISQEKWAKLDFQANLWKNLGSLDSGKIDIEIEHITQEDIEIAVGIINEHIFPWIKDLISTKSDKTRIKTVSMILTDIHSHICTLFPAKGHSKLKDFTSYYYEKQEVSETTLRKLRAVEEEIFNLAEQLHVKVIEDDTMK